MSDRTCSSRSPRSGRALLGLAAGVAAAALSACNTGEVPGYSALAGQDLDAAFALYGPWEQEATIEGERLYIWRRRVVEDGVEKFCELRVTMGFRRTIARSVMQGYPVACRMFSIRYELMTK